MYDTTLLTNASGISDVLHYLNTITVLPGAGPSEPGIFVGLILGAVFFIMIFGLKRYGFANALLVSSWICFIMSMFLRAANLISIVWVIGFIIATAGITMYKITVKPQE